MGFNFEERLCFEDDYAKYYTNTFTKTLTEYAQKDNCSNGNKGVECFVLLAKSKCGDTEYVIFNNKGMPIYANASYESVACMIDVFQFIGM